LSAKDLPAGQTQVKNVRPIRIINRHPVEGDEDSARESNSDTENWLIWSGDLDNPNESDGKCEADDESDTEPCSGITASESPEHRVASAAPNFPELIRPTRKIIKQAENVFVTVSTMETRRIKGNKKK
jgi:hypothetical protein